LFCESLKSRLGLLRHVNLFLGLTSLIFVHLKSMMICNYFLIALTVLLMSTGTLKADDTGIKSREIKNEKLLSRIKQPPSYVRNTNYDKKWFNVLRTGIDKTREYLGNYGPLHVYIIGQESKELEDKEVGEAIIKIFCHCRHAQTQHRIADCLKGTGASLIKRARNNSTEAYLSYVDFIDPPLAELIFINPHGFDMPYLYTRGIHEYTHVFQRGFPSTPTWMTEGSAEFLAFYLGAKNEWINFEQSMKESMRMLQSVENDEVSLVDFEDIEKIERERPELKKYYRHIAYDAGAWAVAFLIHHSENRSVKSFTKIFYQTIGRAGWKEAVKRYAKFDNIAEFYVSFEKFLEESNEKKMQMLNKLKP